MLRKLARQCLAVPQPDKGSGWRRLDHMPPPPALNALTLSCSDVSPTLPIINCENLH